MQYGLVVIWLAMYLVLALAALPLAGLLFPRLADRGAAFTFPLALAVLGIVGYLVGHVAFGWPALLAGLAVLVIASFVGSSRTEVDRQGYIEAVVVFTAAFLLLIAVRAVDPAVHPIGGEKFLDYGLLKSLLRSGALPPEDMWFAGEPVQYYYAGHMLAALLSVLTSTPARFSYNLALAGYYAAFVTAAWGLAVNIAALYDGRRGDGNARGTTSQGRTHRWLVGGLGAFFAGIASNLSTAGRIALWALPDGLARAVGGAFGLPERVIAWTPREFSYWDASRVMPRIPGDPESNMLITEFPLFAWLNGDLHAHMMSTPFMLLLAGLLFSYWLTPEAERWRRRGIVFGIIPPLAGLLAIVNTWSFPTTAGLTLLTLTFAPANPATLLSDRVAQRLTPARWGPAGDPDATAGAVERPDGGAGREKARRWIAEELARSGTAFLLAAGMLAVGAVWSLPFWLGTASGRAIGVPPHRSPLGGLLLVHGTFLVVFIPYLAGRSLTTTEDPLVAAGLAVLAGVVAWLAGFAAVGLFLPLIVVAWLLLRTQRDVGFETVLFIAGAGLVLIVEFVFVEGGLAPGRMDTVFKTYAQTWALWAPAAAVALVRLATGTPISDLSVPGRERWQRAGAALAVALVFTSSLYAGFALPNHFERGGMAASTESPTLDATAFVEVRHPDEAPAIRWIDELNGQPTIVTRPGGYRWNPSQGKGASAPSSLTGIPTVIGWYHEKSYRGAGPYQQRVRDVKAIYTGSPERQGQLLRQYDVKYIYVGPAERNGYGRITVDQSPGVEEYRRLGDVVIYRVNQDKLPG